MSNRADPEVRAETRMRVASALIFVCGMTLCFDLGGELHGLLRYPGSASNLMMVHLFMELLATAGLGWAFVLVRAELRRTALRAETVAERLHVLRRDFDHLLRERLTEWSLSAAGSDVALLTIRGLKIAEMRGSRTGTVKAQLSAILRKSACRTRTEFVARFIDEFLEQSSKAPWTGRAPPFRRAHGPSPASRRARIVSAVLRIAARSGSGRFCQPR